LFVDLEALPTTLFDFAFVVDDVAMSDNCADKIDLFKIEQYLIIKVLMVEVTNSDLVSNTS
jgi:hypothetical protein